MANSLLYITIPKNTNEMKFEVRIKLSNNIYFGKYLQSKHAVSIVEKISVSKTGTARNRWVTMTFRKYEMVRNDITQKIPEGIAWIDFVMIVARMI